MPLTRKERLLLLHWLPLRWLAVAACVSSGACGSSRGGNDGSSEGYDSTSSDRPAENADDQNTQDLSPDFPSSMDTLPQTDAGRDTGPDAEGSDTAADVQNDVGADLGSDLARDSGADAPQEAGADTGYATCPTPPPLTEIPPFGQATTNTVIDLGTSGNAAISSPGSGSFDFEFFYTATKEYTGPFGMPGDSFNRLVKQDPRGLAAIGQNTSGRAVICGGGMCTVLGTLAQHRFAPSGASDINETDTVVGQATLDDDTVLHPFSWTFGGAMVDLGTLGGTFGVARAVNGSGKITGVSTNPTGAGRAYLWDGSMHDLGTLGGASSDGTAINTAGDVVGVSQTAAGDDHAFLWHAGAMHDLGTLGGEMSSATAVNASGQVVGISLTTANQTHAFFWSGGVMHDIGTLGGAGSRLDGPRPLNDAGQVVGTSQNAAGQDHAFIWQLGSIRDLGTLGGVTSAAVSINASGRVVGNSVNASASARAFFVDPGACTAP